MMDIKCSFPNCRQKAFKMMDIKCSFPNCLSEAFWQCNCPGNPMKHVKTNYLNFKAKSNQNALIHVENESIKLSQEMIKEVKNCLESNIYYLNKEKGKIKDLVFNNSGNEAQEISNWAKSLNISKRDKKQFILSTQKLLGVDNNSINIVTDAEKLEDDYKKNKISLEEAIENIEKIEKELYKCDIKLKVQKLNINTAERILQENKVIFPSSDFKGRVKSAKFSNMTCQEKQELLADYDFYNFKKDFINGNRDIFTIHLTNDCFYAFIYWKLKKRMLYTGIIYSVSILYKGRIYSDRIF
ncbi:hypothetical protein SteCoe_38637 [Stentor coeruleus]|uniref:Uncharacterized protein n=1 Tax=Stentor coeruleus TaxID=5963 RepID=A0A1R2AL83_9CILI|nr:hypothetical protein SteCoe_38637 [Stentor coeruleus]